jgi:hypothetical protein
MATVVSVIQPKSRVLFDDSTKSRPQNLLTDRTNIYPAICQGKVRCWMVNAVSRDREIVTFLLDRDPLVPHLGFLSLSL